MTQFFNTYDNHYEMCLQTYFDNIIYVDQLFTTKMAAFYVIAIAINLK